VTRQCDPVGAVEIAARLGVKRRTVDAWRQRDIDFPEPLWQVGGRPAWNWDTIERWAATHGRSTP
jgi:predicted DNA-binding transcriptional regulator AlpA